MDSMPTAQQLAQLQAHMPADAGWPRLRHILSLGWCLAEVDDVQAQVWAEEAGSWLSTHDSNCSDINSWQRLHLIRAKCDLLHARLESAEKGAILVLQMGRTAHNCKACLQAWADACHLLAFIAFERGHRASRDQYWQQCVAYALQAGDQVRADVARVCLAYRAPNQDRAALFAEFGDPGTQGELAHLILQDKHPLLAAWLCELWGMLAFRQGDFATSITHQQRALEYAQESCQGSRVAICCLSIGIAYGNLNDHDAALKWKQRGLQMAQQHGWPGSIGACLVSCGESLRQLHQYQAAREVLQQAFTCLEQLPSSYNYSLALSNRGFLALDEGDFELAKSCFEKLLRRAEEMGTPNFLASSWRGLAEALSGQQQAITALEAGHQSLYLAQQSQNKFDQLQALLTLSMLYARHFLPAPEGISKPRLHYLQQALAVSERIEKHQVSGDLFDALADAWADAGDFAQAYAMARLASAAREKTHGIAATNRAVAMQVQHQTESSQAQKLHHQKLAQAEARRVEVLQQTSNTLAHLSAIGQEITAHLNAQAVFDSLHQHLQGLLELTAFGVYFLQDSQLVLAFGQENGRPLPETVIALDDPHSYAARCMRERREITLELPGTDALPQISTNTLPCMSCLFAPLSVAQRVIGVMSVQSLRPQAFGEREHLIFRSLSAYGAIAFDNARAYQALQETQQQLVAQEKMAALGSLVAGVAHEINTPLGNSLIMASALQIKVGKLLEALGEQNLRYVDLCEFLDDAAQASSLIRRNLDTAAALVGSFKQVAVDRTHVQRRQFDLRQTCQELVATMMNQIRQSGHQIKIVMDEQIQMHSYPGALGQVIGNLISNSLRHAFAEGQCGQMELRARSNGAQQIQLRFADNGCGISTQNIKHIFDPFFTTRMGQGNCGLGLSISFNVVTTLLGGQIRAESVQGEGCCFILDLPLYAPEVQNQRQD